MVRVVAVTEKNSLDDDGGEPSSTVTSTASRRKVRFDDDEQYQPSSHHSVKEATPPSSPPPSQALAATDVNSMKTIDDSLSRQLQDIKDRRGRLLEHREKMVKRQSSGESGGSQGSNERSGSSSNTSTTSSASNSGGDYQTLKTLLSPPKRKNPRVYNQITISEEDEYCGDIVSGSTPKALAVVNGDGGVLSRHFEQSREPLERQGTHGTQGSVSSASSITTLLEHAPLEEHLTGLQKRRSKLLEMVEAQEQNSDDTKKQRSIEFSVFLIKDKLNQLQDLGVLGEDDEDEILKSSGGTRRLLRKIKSEGTHRSEGREVSPYNKRSSTGTPYERFVR